MSVFNEIKRNVTSAASAASKKTNELTGIAKLSMNIKVEQGKLNNCYEEIGRLFYTAERSGEDHTSDIAAHIMQADKIKANIAKYQAEIAKLKKIIICDNCGAELADTCVFCSTCGTKLEKKVAEEEPKAEECCCECDCDCDCDCDCGEEEETCGCCCDTEEPCCCEKNEDAE